MDKQLEKSVFNQQPAVTLESSNKMAILYFKVVLVTLLCGLPSTRTCDPFFGNLNHAMIQNRIFAGKRISEETSPTLLTRDIFTAMECLDICLRLHYCLSFDFMQSAWSNEKICRIYGNEQDTMPLVSEHDWTHFNMSSLYLRKVSWIT